MLRRLLLVGLAWACCCTPALAHAHTVEDGGFVSRASPTKLPATTVAIFYYPWYATPAVDGTWQHWNQNAHLPPSDLYSRFYPTHGPYSSADPAVVDRQMTQIANAGVDEVVISWWGRGSAEDARLPLVAAAARRHHLSIAMHIEPYDGRSPQTLAQDLAYIAGLGVRDVFVYHPRDYTVSDWTALHAQVPSLRLFAGTELVGFAAAAHFDGFYTYDFMNYGGSKFARLCAQARAVHLLCAPSVGPGYDGRRAGESPGGRDRRNGATYDALWSAALAAHPDIVSVTSYNEWGEGTQIEPAQAQHGYRSYDGAWGMVGDAAQFAYLTRTTYWSGLAHATPPAR